MLAIKINPNSQNWQTYEVNIMSLFENSELNKFGRYSEIIIGELGETLITEKNTNDLNMDILPWGYISLDAIINSEICKDFKIGYLYGLNKKHLGEDAILISKVDDNYYIVGFILDIEYINAEDFSNINPQFLPKWCEYVRQLFENIYGKSYLDLFENYKRDFLSNSRSKRRKEAFNMRYSDLFIFEEKDRIIINDELKLIGNFQTRKWISEINPEILQRIIPKHKN